VYGSVRNQYLERKGTCEETPYATPLEQCNGPVDGSFDCGLTGWTLIGVEIASLMQYITGRKEVMKKLANETAHMKV
jgi:hypothetical protein